MMRLLIDPLHVTGRTQLERTFGASWPGLTVYSTSRRPGYSFKYEGSKTEHYLALHDFNRSDGETRIGNLPVSRETEIRNKLTFIPKGVDASGWTDGSGDMNHITMVLLDPAILSGSEASAIVEPQLRPELYFEDEPLRRAVRRLAEIAATDGSALDLYADSLATLMIARLNDRCAIDQQTTAMEPRGARFGDVEEFLRANMHRKVALDEVASVAGLSRFHFIKAFRDESGSTPYQFLLRLRIEEAKRLLRTTKLPLSEISEKVGFGGSSQFVRVFKMAEGTTPGSFRSQAD